MPSDIEQIRELVTECVLTHNEEVLVELISRLESDYVDVCRLATFDAYKTDWTHQEVLDFITYNT